ncbi:MAG: prepilin peptidase [Deltaproteobacteria bacterium]|nr:prepilin peptidase [Deltaproteobacteria bacterium]
MLNDQILETINPGWLQVSAFVLGAFVGSFLNVCISRMPKGESILFPPSHCPLCGHRIRFYDNIPILSFLWLGARCRYCRGPISLQYPLVELVGGMIGLLLFRRYGISVDFAGYFVFSAMIITVSGIDMVHRIIPDRISLPGIGAGLLFSLLTPRMSLLDSLIGTVIGGGSLLVVTWGYSGFVKLKYRITGTSHRKEMAKSLQELTIEELRREASLYGIDAAALQSRKELVTAIGEAKGEGMGGGDVKLLAMIGSFLGGWRPILFVILIASFLGSVVGIPLMLAKGRDSKYAIPFGPFLGAGSIVYLLWGAEMIRWYFGLGR